MDWNSEIQRQAFFAAHSDLPRQGPGNRDCASRALELAQPLASKPRVLDLGCGPGLAAVELAEMLPDATVLGIDLHAPFIDTLNALATERGLEGRVRGTVASMEDAPEADGGYDLLWSEGAAYSIGFEHALNCWHGLLAPGGRLALTEAVWLPAAADPNTGVSPGDHVPTPVKSNWDEYPGLTDLQGCLERIERAGYRVLGDFTLPEEAWWSHYYTPMAERIRQVRPRFEGNPEALQVLDECQSEIDVYREYSEFYGYQFFVLEAR